jgi:hypothetical protein
MMKPSLALVALILAACPLQQQSSSTMPSSSASGPSGAGATGPTGDAGGGDGQRTVPNVIGKTPDEAREIVRAAGFEGVESTRPVSCDDAPDEPGRINCQDPEPGKVVARYVNVIQINVAQSKHRAGIIMRDQLEAMVGLTVDQVKAQLKALGHDGKVIVEEGHSGNLYDKECGDKVCEVSGGAGIGLHDQVHIIINPKLTIAPPPD